MWQFIKNAYFMLGQKTSLNNFQIVFMDLNLITMKLNYKSIIRCFQKRYLENLQPFGDIKFLYFIYLFLVVLGLRSCVRASHCGGFSWCVARALGMWAQQLWHTGLVAMWQVGSSRTRNRTHVPCIGRRILNHCTTREALITHF